MDSELFKPDKFSKSDIIYETASVDAAEIATSILKKYFADIEIKSVKKLVGTEINSNNFKVVTKINQKEQVFLLRKFKYLNTKDTVEFSLKIIRKLEERGVRVSQIMQTLDGKLFAEFNNDLFAVFSFVEANYFWPDYDLLISAAKEIAKMHLGFNSLDDDDFKKIENFSGQGKGYFNVIKDYDREDFIKLKDLIKSKTEQNDTDKLVLGKIDIFLETCDKIKNYLERLEKLPKQIIHSDLHPHNILVNDKEVKVLIDFDSMRISQQARDVAFVIYRLGKQFFVNKDLKEVQENAPKLKDLFVKEYCLVKELTEEENKLLPVLVKDEFLRKLLFVLKGVYQDNNFAWAKDLSSFVASFEEIDYFWPEFKI